MEGLVHLHQCARRISPGPMVGMMLRGDVRVGLEDNVHLSRGQKLKGNGEAVDKVVRCAEELGLPSHRQQQNREMLGLPAPPSSY